MKNYPKISIITPSFNQAEFLEQSIVSVLEQNYSNLEYIIIDGGSSDGSVDIIKKYEKYLTYWVSEKDRGQSHAINKGIKKADGDIVAWINSDDYYLPGAFEAVANAFLNSKTSTGFFFGTGIQVDRNGKKISDFWPHEPVFDYSALIYGFDYILQPTVFIIKNALSDVGLIDENLFYCMDYDLWIRLSKKYDAIPIAHPIAASREYDETKSLSGGIGRCAEITGMIEKHTGFPITPGCLYYLITTIQLLTNSEKTKNIFSKDFQRCLELLHVENLIPLSIFSKSAPGFPENIINNNSIIKMENLVANNTGYLTNLEKQLSDLHKIIKIRTKENNELKKLLNQSNEDRAARLEQVNELGRLLNQSNEDRTARLEQVNELGRLLKESEADRAARLDQINELDRLLKESEADRAARLEVIENQHKQIQILDAEIESLSARLSKIEQNFGVHILRKIGVLKIPK